MITDPKTVLNGVGREAAGFVIRNYKRLALYAAALSLVEVIIWRLLPVDVVTDIIKSVVSSGCYAVFAIMLHRWILLDDTNLRLELNKRTVMFVGMAFAEALLVVLAAAVVFLPFFGLGIMLAMIFPSDFIAPILLYAGFAAAAVCALFIIARFITIFPTIAVTKLEKLSFRSIEVGYQATNGAAWEISKRLVIFFVAGLAYLMATDFLSPYEALPDTDGFMWAPVRFLLAYLEFLLAYAPIPFFVALASFIYCRIINDLRSNANNA